MPRRTSAAAYTKILVLLTDGLNTASRASNDTATIDARTAIACANAKAKGIVVYTIGLMAENAALLTGCASTPARHFFAPTPAQIPDIFEMISKELVTVRLTRLSRSTSLKVARWLALAPAISIFMDGFSESSPAKCSGSP